MHLAEKLAGFIVKAWWNSKALSPAGDPKRYNFEMRSDHGEHPAIKDVC